MVDLDNNDEIKLSKPDHLYSDSLSLITAERTEKLALLQHLISNFNQPIVLCGPTGIGKTTLLRVLQEQKPNAWHYFTLIGSAELAAASVQRFLLDQNSTPQYQKTILVIDDAGLLVPGTITAIIDYAATQALLTVIFVLTADELYLKNCSDSVIDNCHFVEIPPLSEKQCGEFLQYLSTQPTVRLSLEDISDTVVANTYRETHGLPARIIAALPALTHVRHRDKTTLLLITAVIMLVAITLAVQRLSNADLPIISRLTELLQKILQP